MLDYVLQLWCIFRFAAAMFIKLRASERKYQWVGAWRLTLDKAGNSYCLRDHVAKGDPRDVGIYAAFAHWHGWDTR